MTIARPAMMLTIPLAALITNACSNSAGTGDVCTASFAYATATVIDGTGRGIGTVTVRDTVKPTGVGFTVTQSNILGANRAVVFDDSHKGDVREAGDTVTVLGVSETGSFNATYVFGSDGCHINKLAGPDTVTLR